MPIIMGGGGGVKKGKTLTTWPEYILDKTTCRRRVEGRTTNIFSLPDLLIVFQKFCGWLPSSQPICKQAASLTNSFVDQIKLSQFQKLWLLLRRLHGNFSLCLIALNIIFYKEFDTQIMFQCFLSFFSIFLSMLLSNKPFSKKP